MLDFYRSLAALLRAGMVMGEALATLRTNGTLKDPLGEALERTVTGGAPLSAAMSRWPDDFPMEDVALVEAGEVSGRIEDMLDRIAALEIERREGRSALLTAIWYPILLVHIAAFLLPVAGLARTRELSFGVWLGKVLLLLGPIYLLFFGIRYLNRSAAWRERFRNIIDRVPGFGAAARRRRRARFANVLEATYSAGIRIDRCLYLAGHAARVPSAEEASQAVAQGEQLTPALASTGVLGSSALSRIATGEQAGDISGTLSAIAIEEREQASEISRRSMITLGKVIYLLVVLWIAVSVISFYASLYSGIF